MASEFWTEDRVVLVRKHHKDGLGASESARLLGNGCTRNSVLSKRHRLGLFGRPGKSRPTTPRSRKQAKNRADQPNHAHALRFGPEREPSAPHPMPVADPDDVASMKILVVIDGKLHANDKLTAACCRWPCGDPQHDDFGFCGQATVAQFAYCERHLRKATQPPSVSLRRRKIEEPVTVNKEFA